tara:strand:- start:28082 stop:28249 length:168 start_codon:yes stop_codon:yes gene_type:complete
MRSVETIDERPALPVAVTLPGGMSNRSAGRAILPAEISGLDGGRKFALMSYYSTK